MTKNKKLVKKDYEMPKKYSENEKIFIVKRLKEEANILLQEKGVKKTTVDELVERVGIPKGTFYLFYPSKEMLFFDVTQDYHEQVDEYISEGLGKLVTEKNLSLETPDFTGCVEELTDIIFGAMEITYSSCLKVLLDPEAISLVLSKIPDDVLAKHRVDDENTGNGIIRSLLIKKGMNVEAVVGAFTIILMGGMYKRMIGEKNWKNSMRTSIKGLVLQIIEGE